ncbi:MAG: ATP-binding protein, partial [Candidatus Sericytochromatia bacterium]
AVERRRLQSENLRMQTSLAETVLALQASLNATERSRRRLETLMEAFDAGVVLLDAAGRIERINGAARRMFRAEAAADLPGLLAGVGEAIGEDGSPIDLDAWLMGEAQLDTEVVVRWPDGAESALLVAAKPVPGGGDLPPGRLVVFRDVTGRHQRRGKLEALLNQLSGQVETGDALRASEVQHAADEAERVKNQILSAVSHELRTPLNFIVGFGSVLADGIAGELTPEQFRLVEKMLSGAERLTATVDDLLNYAMLTSGMLEAGSEPLDLAGLAREVEGFMRPEAENKNLALKTRLEAGPEAPVGDAAFVKHIVRHLVANAIKFTAPGGTVTLRSGGGPGEAWIEVEDTGIGMAPETQKRLFERFYQAEASPTRRFGGTGMGLALARGLAELMKARIDVASELGRGSRFRLTFSTLGR